MTTLEIPDADPADIIIEVRGDYVRRVTAPPTLSIQVRNYGMYHGGAQVCRDEQGRPCAVTWIKEPGTANAEQPV